MSKQRIVKLAKFTAGVAILLCLAYPLRAAASTISTFNTGMTDRTLPATQSDTPATTADHMVQ